MDNHEKHAYLEAIRKRYRKTKRADKGKILDEFCSVCNYQRKYAIRLLRRKVSRTPRRPGRPSRYNQPELLAVLRKIWLATDQMCSKRLVAAMPLWLPHYEVSFGVLEESVKSKLAGISSASIDRLLKPVRAQHPKGLSGTKPGTLLKNQIPIRTTHWDITLPGFMEADTVAHCGNSLAGDFVWSLTLTDILTGWTECRATWNKGSGGVLDQIKSIEQALPFELRGFDCDNGSEFLNYHLLRYFTDHPDKPSFTRSRPYKKNDNAHVEQKNWTHVRQLFGYERFDNLKLVKLMNALYANEWSQLQNHFCPTLKLKGKMRIGARYRKQYYPPETPYQRVLVCESVSDDEKSKLRILHETINPFDLRQKINAKLRTIFSMVKVTSIVRQRS
jgi:hypothetical protein